MKDYGRVRSRIRPEEMLIDAYSVWVHSDIKDVEILNDKKQVLFKGYEYSMKQYPKDEFIFQQLEKNKSLEDQLTNTQLALTEVYELLEA